MRYLSCSNRSFPIRAFCLFDRQKRRVWLFSSQEDFLVLFSSFIERLVIDFVDVVIFQARIFNRDTFLIPNGECRTVDPSVIAGRITVE